MEFWIRRKYRLLPNDPRFLELTEEDVEAEYLAHQYAEKNGVPDEIEDENFDEHLAELESDLGVTPAAPGAGVVSVTSGQEDEFEEVINDKRH
jgi:hypothetical protein